MQADRAPSSAGRSARPRSRQVPSAGPAGLHRATRRGLLAGAGALLALLVAGCAGPAPVEPAPPEPPAPGPPLVVASDLDNMPFAGVDEAGTPVGRDVEMMTALAARLNRPIEWKRIPFETLLPSAQAGLVDVVCATIGIAPDRAEIIDFSEPYFETTIEVVVRAGPDEPHSWADLDERRVAAGQGTTSERAVARVLPRAVAVLENKQQLSAAERLLLGEVDGVAMDGPNARALVAESDGSLALLRSHLAVERYALVLPPDRDTLRAALDAALADMMRSGELAALDERWGLDSGS